MVTLVIEQRRYRLGWSFGSCRDAAVFRSRRGSGAPVCEQCSTRILLFLRILLFPESSTKAISSSADLDRATFGPSWLDASSADLIRWMRGEGGLRCML